MTPTQTATLTAPATTPEQVADQLLDVAPLITRWIRGEMRGASAGSLTVLQLRALLFVRRHSGTHLSPLAEHLGVGMTTASGLVERLVRQGLLTRAQDPAVRRRVRLELTPEGDARVQRSRRKTRAALAATLEGFNAAQLGGIHRAFADLRAVFQSASAPTEAS